MSDSSEEQVSEETVEAGGVAVEVESDGKTSEESAQTEEESTDVHPELSKVSLDDLEGEAKELAEKRLKEMESAFTKDRQGIGELRKKAELYDQYQQEELVRQKFPKETKPSGETTSFLAEALNVDVSTLDAEQRTQLEQLAKIVDFAATKRVQEQIQPLQHDLLTKDFKQELESTKKKYADFDNYKVEIQTILQQNPQMGYEQAYKIATWDEQSKKGRTEAMKNLEVKKKQSQPKTTASAKEDESPKGFENIFKWARKKTAEQA